MLKHLQKGFLLPHLHPSPFLWSWSTFGGGREGVLIRHDRPAPFVTRTFARWRTMPGEQPAALSALASWQPALSWPRWGPLCPASHGPSAPSCSQKSWGVDPEAGAEAACVLQLCFPGLPLSSPVSCASLVLRLPLCAFSCHLLPFKPKVFKVRPWVTPPPPPGGLARESLESVSQSIHQYHFSSLCYRRPVCLSCSASVPLSASLSQTCSGDTLPVFKFWSYCVTLDR